jgi:hypothetical protein
VSAFRGLARTFTGTLTVRARPDDAFPLFSPAGERRWVPGWDPEAVHPAEDDWRAGQVFRTREETGAAVWIVTAMDRARRTVEYHRVEPARWVARVAVGCDPLPDGATRVTVSYSFVGLTDAGNEGIAAMTQEEHDAKMRRWAGWIERYLAGA